MKKHLLVMAMAINLVMIPSSWAEVSLKTTKVRNNIYMIEGVNGFVGGNVAVSVGDDGVLLVDSLVNGRAGQLNKALTSLGNTNTRYLLNTHWHGDHTGGNAELSERAAIVAHDNVREYLQHDQKNYFGESKAAPQAAWPVLTFDSKMTIYFNDDKIKLTHYPNGHTNGDAVIYFTKANVLHMGDQFFKDIFPFVDLSTGGSVLGLAENIATVMTLMPKDVLIIPGHGTLAVMDDLHRYRDMLNHSISSVQKGITAGLTLAQIQSKGLGESMQDWGKGFIPLSDWIEFTYLSIKQRQGLTGGHSHGNLTHHL